MPLLQHKECHNKEHYTENEEETHPVLWHLMKLVYRLLKAIMIYSLMIIEEHDIPNEERNHFKT